LDGTLSRSIPKPESGLRATTSTVGGVTGGASCAAAAVGS
jgi:hypothetical protein